MRRGMRRLLAGLLSVLMIVTAVPTGSLTALAQGSESECQDTALVTSIEELDEESVVEETQSQETESVVEETQPQETESAVEETQSQETESATEENATQESVSDNETGTDTICEDDVLENTYTVDFLLQNASVYNITLYEDEIYYEEGTEPLEEVSVEAGEDFYFSLNNYIEEIGQASNVTYFVSTNGTESGKIEPYINIGGKDIYKITVTSDMEITVKVMPQTVKVVSDGINNLTLTPFMQGCTVSEDNKTISMYQDGQIDISFKGESMKFYYLYHEHETLEERWNDDYSECWYETVVVREPVDLNYDEETEIYTASVYLTNETLSLEFEKKDGCVITFQAENANVYEAYCYDEENNLWNLTSDVLQTIVPKGSTFYFGVCPIRGDLNIVSPFVSTDGTEKGLVPVCGKTDMNVDIYALKVNESVDVAAKMRPHSVALKGMDSLQELTITSDADGGITVDNKNTEIDLYIESTSSFRFKEEEGKTYQIKYLFEGKEPVYDKDGQYVYDEEGNVLSRDVKYERTILPSYEDGYYSFNLHMERAVKEITVLSGEGNTVTFNNPDTGTVFVREVYLLENADGYIRGESIPESRKLVEGESLYFTVDHSLGSYGVLSLSIDGEELTPYKTYNGEDIYKVTPTEATTVDINMSSKTIKINGTAGLKEYALTTESEYVTVAEDMSQVSISDSADIHFKFKVEENVAYALVINHTEKTEKYDNFGNYLKDENGNIVYDVKTYAHSVGIAPTDEGYYDFNLNVKGTYDSIDIYANEGCDLTFDIKNVDVQEVFLYDSESWFTEGPSIEGTISRAKGGVIFFKVQSTDASIDLSYADYVVTVDGEEIETYWQNDGEYIYKIVPEADMNIGVEMKSKCEIPIIIEGGELEGYSVSANSYPEAIISEDGKTVSIFRPTELRLRYKPADNMKYVAYRSVWQDTGNMTEDGEIIIELVEDPIEFMTDADEEYCYADVSVDYNTESITIEQKELVTITFAKEKTTVNSVGGNWNDYGEGPVIEYMEEGEITEPVKIGKGESLLFTANVFTEYSLGKAEVYVNNEKLSSIGYTDMMNPVYKVTSSEDITITAKAIPKKVKINKPANLENYTMEATGQMTDVMVQEEDGIGIYSDATLNVSFIPKADKIYEAFQTKVEEEWYEDENYNHVSRWKEVEEPISLQEDEEGNLSFTTNLDGYSVAVTIIEHDTSELTFAMENVTVNEIEVWYYDNGEGNMMPEYTDTREIGSESFRVKKGIDYYFAVSTLKTAGKILVTTNGEESGKIESIGLKDGEIPVYKIKPEEDTTITVKVVPVTVSYNCEIIPENFSIGVADEYDIWVDYDECTIGFVEPITAVMEFTPDDNYFYNLYVTETALVSGEDEEGNPIEVEEELTVEIDPTTTQEGNYIYQIDLNNPSQVITLEVREKCNITFESGFDVFYKYNFDHSKEYISEATLPQGKEFAFGIDMSSLTDFTLLYVTSTGDRSGTIETRWNVKLEDDLYHFTPQEDTVITAVIVPNERSVSFNNLSVNMTYSVETNDYVTENENDGYDISIEAETFKFNITSAEEGLEPTVTYPTLSGESITAEYDSKTVNDDGTVTYDYSILYEYIGNKTVFTINEAEVRYDVLVKCDAEAMKTLTAIAGDQELEAIQTAEDNVVLFRTPFGKDISLVMETTEGYLVNSVKTTQDDVVTEKEINAKEYTLILGIISNTTIEITTEEKLSVAAVKVLEGQDAVLQLTNQADEHSSAVVGRYDITEGTYLGNVFDAKGNPVGVNTVDVAEAYKPYITITDDNLLRVDATGILKADTETVEHVVSIKATDSKYGKTVQFIFVITPKLQKVTIQGVTDGKIAQQVDTKIAYPVTMTPEVVDLSKIGVEVILADGVQDDAVEAWMQGSELIIETAVAEPKENAATIKLYRMDCLDSDTDYYIPGSEITVSTVRPAILENTTPDAKLDLADDVSLTLAVKVPDTIMPAKAGRQFYKVVVTPKDSENGIPDSISSATEEPFYIEREIPDFSAITNEKKLKDAKEAYRQIMKLPVNNSPCGYGTKWLYDVEVTLVQTSGQENLTKENEEELIVYSSKTVSLSNLSTLDAVFETKIGVKNKKTTVYTTQQDVLAAVVSYSKGTNSRGITATDITDCEAGEKLHVMVIGDEIYVSAYADTKLGKHTIQIVPAGSPSLYQNSKNLTVTVQKGIEDLDLQIPSYSIYKQDKKAASMTAKIVYNTNDTAPKTKKVTWEVVNEAGDAFAPGDDLYGMLQIKNGKVTVNKAYVVTEGSNKFRILATAADFAGNNTYVLSDVITITSQVQEIETVVAIKENATTGCYDVVAKDGAKITSDILQDATLVALEKGAPVKTSYTKTEIATYGLEASEVTYKSSNKAVQVVQDEDTTLKVTKPANKVSLTATTSDGGKKKVTIKFDVIYQAPNELGLALYQDGHSLEQIDATNVTFNGTVNTVVTVEVNQKASEDADWDNLIGFTNHTLKVKNGKILTSDVENGIYQIIVTKDVATLTLQDKANKVNKTYTLTNESYSAEKAPKIKVANTLRAEDIVAQDITFTLPAGYDCTDKVVIVETDTVTKQKKVAAYTKLEDGCDTFGTLITVEDEKFTLSFEGSKIPKESYKLTVTVGAIDNEGKFVAIAKPVNVTLKCAVPKAVKGSFTPTASYKIDAVPGASVELTGKGKEIKSYNFTRMYNMNIKGKENAFLSYFALEGNKLVLRNDLTDEDIAYITSKAGKNDLSGYVTYTATYGDDGYGNPYTKTATVKITVKFK